MENRIAEIIAWEIDECGMRNDELKKERQIILMIRLRQAFSAFDNPASFLSSVHHSSFQQRPATDHCA